MYHNNTNRKLPLQNYTYFYYYQSFFMSFNTLLYNLRHLQGTEKEGRGKQRRNNGEVNRVTEPVPMTLFSQCLFCPSLWFWSLAEKIPLALQVLSIIINHAYK